MFTGIVEETGIVERIEPGAKSIRLGIGMRLCARDLKVGDSLAINGCCLTAAKIGRRRAARIVHFDLLKETWDRTNLRLAKPGSIVNLERPLAANGRVGGHFVTGHVDGTGKIVRLARVGRDRVLDIQGPSTVMPYVIPKGSIAVDGISLTVASVAGNNFRIWIIPHTWEITAIHRRDVGETVNLEADLLGKYVKQFISSASKS